YWEFQIVNTTGSTLTAINLVFKNDVKAVLSIDHGFTAAGVKKTWALSGGSVAAGETVLVTGRSIKAAPQLIAKLYLGVTDKTPDLKNVLALKNVAKLPMPNAATIRNTAFILAGLSKGHPLTVGIARVDSPKVYGWVNLGKGDDMYKSMEDKNGRHTNVGTGFDLLNGKTFAKAQTSLPPT